VLQMPLQPPPLDADGNVVPHDHDGILADDILIRRISEQHILGPEGSRRISTMAFQGSSDGTGMSVDIEKLIREAMLDPATFVTTEEYFCSVQFKTAQIRAEALQVGYYPLVENPYHGAVWGIGSKGQRNRLRRMAQWFVEGIGIALNDAA